MVTKMTKYSFILLSGDTDAFLNKIQELGVVDITRSAKPIDTGSADMLDKAMDLKQTVTFLKTVDYSKDEHVDDIVNATKEFQLAEQPALRVNQLRARLSELEAQMTALHREKEARLPWGEFDKNKLDALAEQGYDLHFHKVEKKKFDPQWGELLPLQVVEDDGSHVWFVTVTAEGVDYVFPVAELEVPRGSAADSDAEMAAVASEMIRCKAELLRQREAITVMEQEYRQELSNLDVYLAKSSTETAAEGLLSLIVGFAPTEDDARLAAAFDQFDVVFLQEPAVVEDNPPIKLKNHWFSSMFELLTDMYGRPKYNEFDPTVFISIFFMLFFAFCMGDAGYGLVLILASLGLKKKLGKIAPLGVTLGVATTVVGLLFHTFFSTDMLTWKCIPDAVKRCMLPAQIAGFDGTMVLAILVGIVHICLAMIVKTYQSTKVKGFANSLGTWGWTLLIVGGVIVGGLALMGVMDKAVTKWVIIVLGVLSALGIFFLNDLHRNPLKNFGSGLWETYNTATGLLGDVLSYLRLYALGLAGAKLGEAFNAIGLQALGDGGARWIPFVLIVVIGHTLNVAMCVLGAFVHPLRLNFLEFFKNSGYEGSGRNYNPLQSTKQ